MSSTRAASIVRAAWMATFVVPLILAALLLAAKTAEAASHPTVVPFAFEEQLEAEGEDEFEAGECEEANDELGEGELTQTEVDEICAEANDEDEDRKKASGPNAVAPEECLLKSATARLVAYDSHNDVRLTVGYTTYEPTTATIDYGLVGGKGSLHLGTIKRHLGKSGVVRLTKALADPQMEKVNAAGHFVVELRIAGSPSNCRSFETEQLKVKRLSKSQVIWSESK